MYNDTPVPSGDGAKDLEIVSDVKAFAQPFAAAAFGPADPRTAGGGQNAQISRLVSAIMRYKLLVVVCVGLGLVAGYFARRFSAPAYSAEATVWIQVPSEREA